MTEREKSEICKGYADLIVKKEKLIHEIWETEFAIRRLEERAFDEGAKWWDATYAIRPNGVVIAQLIVFRTKNGYDKYKYDGVTLFDDPYN